MLSISEDSKNITENRLEDCVSRSDDVKQHIPETQIDQVETLDGDSNMSSIPEDSENITEDLDLKQTSVSEDCVSRLDDVKHHISETQIDQIEILDGDSNMLSVSEDSRNITKDLDVKQTSVSEDCVSRLDDVKHHISATQIDQVETLDGDSKMSRISEDSKTINEDLDVKQTSVSEDCASRLDDVKQHISATQIDQIETQDSDLNVSSISEDSKNTNEDLDAKQTRSTDKENSPDKMNTTKGNRLTTTDLPIECGPDTIILIDLSGKRIATRDELRLNENIAMVIFGYKTEVKHHLTSDYAIVKLHLNTLPEPAGPSPLIPGLKLCQAVIATRGKISVIGGRKNRSKFHPRILLLSDGNLTPSECVIEINTLKISILPRQTNKQR
ncbi:unnamed protein product [Mytilus edulis]|uniref:Uncharacterized protein n=1 Tax=Mytilus edulis TaxID=6550 RepID=A0A8S3Q8A5_MYTED|nr:unnamed protein product [Mytilus edulis]